MDEVWYDHFNTQSSENEDYRLHFVFDQKRHVNYRNYDVKGDKIRDYVHKEIVVTAGLYEYYPEFNHYERLVSLERDFPVNIVPSLSDRNKI